VRGYETILIADPEITEDEINTITNRMSETITQSQGKVVKIEKWGKRKLSHKVKKNQKGFYVILYFLSPPQAVKEIERTLRYNEKVLRYQTIQTGIAPAVSEVQVPSEEGVAPREDVLPPVEKGI
jgi:small subunit ribosomal protein S6